MQEKLNLLKSFVSELKEKYECYCEDEYTELAPVHWCRATDTYDTPDYNEWVEKNCLNYTDWLKETDNSYLLKEILDCVDSILGDD